MIIVDAVSKSFLAKNESRKILDGVSLTVNSGEFVSIFGPNGCGKSTLLSLISGLLKEDSGSISRGGISKKEIGYLWQDYRATLLPWLSTRENILFPLKLRGFSKKECERALHEVLSIVPIRFALDGRVTELSGGQAQLVALARALIIRPKLLLLDEPFSALDYETTLELREILSSITATLGLTTILISHDIEEALFLSHRVLLMSKAPSVIFQEIQVPWNFPRRLSLLGDSEFAALKLQAIENCRGIHKNPEANLPFVSCHEAYSGR